MQDKGYRKTYLAALEVANLDLDQIIHEFEQLQLRKHQLEAAVTTLEPFLRSAQATSYELRQPEPVEAKPVHVEAEPEAPKPFFRAVQTPEPVAAAAFSPVPDTTLDPIQSRINRALGLAVA